MACLKFQVFARGSESREDAIVRFWLSLDEKQDSIHVHEVPIDADEDVLSRQKLFINDLKHRCAENTIIVYTENMPGQLDICVLSNCNKQTEWTHRMTEEGTVEKRSEFKEKKQEQTDNTINDFVSLLCENKPSFNDITTPSMFTACLKLCAFWIRCGKHNQAMTDAVYAALMCKQNDLDINDFLALIDPENMHFKDGEPVSAIATISHSLHQDSYIQHFVRLLLTALEVSDELPLDDNYTMQHEQLQMQLICYAELITCRPKTSTRSRINLLASEVEYDDTNLRQALPFNEAIRKLSVREWIKSLPKCIEHLCQTSLDGTHLKYPNRERIIYFLRFCVKDDETQKRFWYELLQNDPKVDNRNSEKEFYDSQNHWAMQLSLFKREVIPANCETSITNMVCRYTTDVAQVTKAQTDCAKHYTDSYINVVPRTIITSPISYYSCSNRQFL
jgi:hypothetical protein